jgi:acyl carrier protein
MKPDDIEQKVIKIIHNQLNVPKEVVSREKSLVNDLGADSLDTAELIMSTEDTFGIFISEEAAKKIQTVGDAIKYIEKKTR